MNTKKCSKCKQIKPTIDFYKDKSRKDLLCNNCKICTAKLCKQHRLNNHEEYLKKEKK